MLRSVLLTTVATGAACALVAATPVAAQAHGGGGHAPRVEVLDDSVLAPFQLDAARHGLYASDGFTSRVVRLGRGGLTTVAQEAAGADVAGVAVNDRGDLAWTTSVGGPEGFLSNELVVRKKRGGTMRVDLKAYEQRRNPDAHSRYGIDNPTPCQEEAFEPFGGASSRGIVDSHPYAVAPYGDGWVVADAGGNDLLKVSAKGRVSTIAVLPPQPARITAAGAASLGLPDCVVGAVYRFDPVPTDVEVTRHGLVVSLLPGGPEDPAFGARGSVYKVDPRSGKAQRLAGGFLGATNVAVDPRGRIFVAELFAGRVSVVDHGKVRRYVDLPNALSLDWSRGTLYAGTLAPTDDEGNPTGPGTLVAIR